MTAISDNDDAKAIKALIRHFFNAINAADTEALQAHFLPSANLAIIRQDPPAQPDATPDKDDTELKITVLLRTTIETFIKMIEDGKKRRHGKPGPKLHEWPLLDETDVRTDGLFGTAWSPFKVTFDGELHHYGVIVFTVGYTSTPGGDGPHDKVCLARASLFPHFILGSLDSQEWKIIGLEQSYRRTPGWEGQSSEFM